MTESTDLTDEVLMAYADDRLDPQERAAVESRLAEDPLLMDRVERMQRSAELLREAVSAPMHEAPPQALIDTILGADSGVVSLESRRPRPVWQPYSIAASILVALGVGLGAGLYWPQLSGDTTMHLAVGPVPQDSPLHQVLETRPSGDALASGLGARALVAVLTFRDGVGRACREVELVPQDLASAPSEVAIACRSDGGGWTVEGAVQVAIEGTPGSDGGVRPASGPDSPTVDAVMESIGAGLPLSPQEEADLLQGGWR